MIVGEPEAMAALDMAAFPVAWAELTPVMSLDDAQAPGAPKLHDAARGQHPDPWQRSSRRPGPGVHGGGGRGRGHLRDRLHRARIHRARGRVRGARRRPGRGAGDDAVPAHGPDRARGDPRSARGRGPDQAHGGRRRVREQARSVGAAVPRAGRVEAGPARAPHLHAPRVDDVHDQAASFSAPRPYRRHARRPPHRDGLQRRVQHRGVCIVGFDGGEPCPGPRRRSVRLRRLSRAHRRHPYERATVGRVPRFRRAAIDDRAGVPVRRARGCRRDRSARVPVPQRAHGGRADGHRSGVRVGHRVSRLSGGACVRTGRVPAPRRRRRTPTVARREGASASPACGTAAGTRRCRTRRRSRSGSGATGASRSIRERSTWGRAPTR